MDILSLKREAISKLPPIHCTCDKPLFEGDYVVGLHYWCNDNHDYFFSEENANWIDDWVYFATTWRYDGGEKYIREVNEPVLG